MASDIDLVTLISSLREQLSEAETNAQGSSLSFEVGPIDLDLSVRVENTGSAGGGVRFWVISAEGKAETARETVQRIRLTLSPYPAGQPGRRLAVGGNSFADER